MASFPRSVLITGASRGLGLEFVRQMAKLPDAPEIIFAACRSPDKASELQKIADGSEQSKVHLLKLDVVSDEDIKSAAYEVGAILGENGLNLLINNAGILERDQLGSLTRESLIRHFNVNTCGTLLTSQEFLPLLRKAAKKNAAQPMGIAKSAMISISTGVASLGDNNSGGRLGGYPYRCSKVALNMGTRCMALDLKEEGIMAVNILPGYVATDMTGNTGNITPGITHKLPHHAWPRELASLVRAREEISDGRAVATEREAHRSHSPAIRNFLPGCYERSEFSRSEVLAFRNLWQIPQRRA